MSILLRRRTALSVLDGVADGGAGLPRGDSPLHYSVLIWPRFFACGEVDADGRGR